MASKPIIQEFATEPLWVNRFGGYFANCIRRDRPRPNDKWHLDEVVITIRGKFAGNLPHFTLLSLPISTNIDILIRATISRLAEPQLSPSAPDSFGMNHGNRANSETSSHLSNSALRSAVQENWLTSIFLLQPDDGICATLS